MSKEKGVWRTIMGRRVFIADGRSLTEAMQASGKFKKEELKNNNSKDMKAKASAEDKTTIKEEVQAGMSKLKGTKIIATVPKSEIQTDFKTAITALRAKLSKNGGIVSRKGFGDVQVGSRLKKAGAYIKTTAEIAAIATVPSVIEKGVYIDNHKNHKGRGYPSYLFAGRVSIAGQKGVVAVVVKKTTGNFYKVHRVLTPDGKDLKIKNDTD